MLQAGALALIDAYQRHLSPRKGYACALRACRGGRSCSRYGARAIARAGLGAGAILIRRRLRACAAAATALAQQAPAEGEWEAGEKRFFGACAPAVSEGRKLCCGSLVGGILSSGGDRP
jgi:putative component of membrane protein insertase Oxa1/YidC/SpoIIIJ protein YidD